MSKKILIKNVKVILTNKILERHSVFVIDGKISDIIPESPDVKYEDFDIIDGKNNYISPGFIDIHTHGNSGHDILDSTSDALEKISKYNLENGVTTYLGTIITSSIENTKKAIRNVNEYKEKNKNSNLLGVHLEGPFFNNLRKGAQNHRYILMPDIEIMRELLNESNNSIRMISIAPELNGSLEIIKFLRDNDITITLAHTDASYQEAVLGIDAGITVATHLFNGMRPFSHREPGVIGAALLDDRVFCEIIADSVHLHDATILLTMKIKGYDKIILISDSISAAGLEDGEYYLGGQRIYVNKGISKLESGNLAGSTTNLRKSIRYMIYNLKVPIYEAVKMATINPAKAINCHEYIGSIEKGKKADLTIFDDNIDIKMTIKNGFITYNRQ